MALTIGPNRFDFSCLHDAELLSIANIDRQSVSFIFETAEGQYVTLELAGVVELYIRDVRQQNVVMDITMRPINAAPIECILNELKHVSDGNCPLMSDTDFEQLANRKDLQFFCLEPSLGCLAYAICSSAVLSPKTANSDC